VSDKEFEGGWLVGGDNDDELGVQEARRVGGSSNGVSKLVDGERSGRCTLSTLLCDDSCWRWQL
jgi:hypothetical protein